MVDTKSVVLLAVEMFGHGLSQVFDATELQPCCLSLALQSFLLRRGSESKHGKLA